MHIAQMLDSLSGGGAQKMQLFLVETLRPLGIDITVISLHDSSHAPIAAQLQNAGVRVVDFPFPQLFSPGSFVQLVRFLRAEKFDLLHAYLTYSNIVGSLAGVLSGTPAIVSLRSADFERKSYTPQREFLETFAIRYGATRIMANGQAVAEFARQRVNNRRPVDIIPNAVACKAAISPAEREQTRQEITGDAKRPFVLSVGRLTIAKGFHDLIDAFAIVQVQVPSAALVIAGGGSLLDEFKTHIQRLGLEKHVFLIGYREDVCNLLAAADVYVNSSHREGTPVSVLEAMSAGLPVVATNVGENPYLLDESAGLLVSPHQPQELAAAIIALLASAEKCAALGQSARERTRLYYSRGAWRKSVLDLYAQITPKAQPYLAQVLANHSLVSEVK